MYNARFTAASAGCPSLSLPPSSRLQSSPPRHRRPSLSSLRSTLLLSLRPLQLVVVIDAVVVVVGVVVVVVVVGDARGSELRRYCYRCSDRVVVVVIVVVLIAVAVVMVVVGGVVRLGCRGRRRSCSRLCRLGRRRSGLRRQRAPVPPVVVIVVVAAGGARAVGCVGSLGAHSGSCCCHHRRRRGRLQVRPRLVVGVPAVRGCVSRQGAYRHHHRRSVIDWRACAGSGLTPATSVTCCMDTKRSG